MVRISVILVLDALCLVATARNKPDGEGGEKPNGSGGSKPSGSGGNNNHAGLATSIIPSLVHAHTGANGVQRFVVPTSIDGLPTHSLSGGDRYGYANHTTLFWCVHRMA